MNDDQDAVRRLAAGDEGAIEELLRAHLPDLRGFLRLRTGPHLKAVESTSDLVQSVCREILEHRDRFQFPGENGFRRWLYLTALRKVSKRVAYYDAEKREVSRSVPLQSAPQNPDGLARCYRAVSSPSAALQTREEVERIERAFEQLPENYREVITLIRIVGLSHKETAERTGQTEGAVRMQLYRGLERLSEILGDLPE